LANGIALEKSGIHFSRHRTDKPIIVLTAFLERNSAAMNIVEALIASMPYIKEDRAVVSIRHGIR
jgi:hypothetical protein